MPATLDDVVKILQDNQRMLQANVQSTKSTATNLTQFTQYFSRKDQKDAHEKLEAARESKDTKRSDFLSGGVFGDMRTAASSASTKANRGWQSWLPGGATMAGGMAGGTVLGKALTKGLLGQLLKRGIPGLIGLQFADEIANFMFGKEGESDLRDQLEKSMNVEGAIKGGALALAVGKKFLPFGALLGAIWNDEVSESVTELNKTFTATVKPELSAAYLSLHATVKQLTGTDLPNFGLGMKEVNRIVENMSSSLANGLDEINLILQGKGEFAWTEGVKDASFWGLLGVKMLSVNKKLRRSKNMKAKFAGYVLDSLLLGLGVDQLLGADETPFDPSKDPYAEPGRPGGKNVNMPGPWEIAFNAALTGVGVTTTVKNLSGLGKKWNNAGNAYKSWTTFGKNMGGLKSFHNQPNWLKNASGSVVDKIKKAGFAITKHGFLYDSKTGKMISGKAAAAAFVKLGIAAPKGALWRTLSAIGAKKIVIGIGAVTAGVLGAPVVATGLAVAGIALTVYEAGYWIKHALIYFDILPKWMEDLTWSDLWDPAGWLAAGAKIFGVEGVAAEITESQFGNNRIANASISNGSTITSTSGPPFRRNPTFDALNGSNAPAGYGLPNSILNMDGSVNTTNINPGAVHYWSTMLENNHDFEYMNSVMGSRNAERWGY